MRPTRYRLPTLLIAVAIAALFFGALAWQQRRVARRVRAEQLRAEIEVNRVARRKTLASFAPAAGVGEGPDAASRDRRNLTDAPREGERSLFGELSSLDP